MVRKSLLAGALFTAITTIAAAAETFIRVDEDETAARLQTAIIRYERDGVSVELIGAVHIADKPYYLALNKRFEAYDVLLFEMIGGEKMAAAPVPEPVEPAEPAKNNLSGLHKVYDGISRFLRLSGQSDHIDYSAKNFVHADLTLAEFTALQTERKESLIGFAIKAGMEAEEDKEHQPNPVKLLRAIVSRSPNLLKLEIIHTLGQGDDQIASLTGESVIITDRNVRCLEVMDREIAAGRKNIGIFYGAAHFPDMEKRLLDQGFQRTRQEWMTAWDVPKK